MRNKAVTDEQMQLLGTGDLIISRVKELLPFGSGNQVSSSNAFPSGENRVLTQLAYGYYNCAKPRHTAIGALVAKSGNCDQMGAMSYVLCREALPPNCTVAWVTGPGHSFAIVGVAGWSIDHCVAVDPWPIKAQAVLYGDHFMNGSTLNFLAQKNCKGQAVDMNKYQGMISGIQNHRNTIELSNWQSSPPSFSTYDHQYCTADGSIMNYFVPMEID